jgi:hypothetical protein
LQTHRKRDEPLKGQPTRLPLRQGALFADAVFEDMLTGWKQQQLARNFGRHNPGT